jgi:2,4-dienoyl-CoA reductase-like NADH-dependent reductase (Old Yellow Enzyme family)
MTLLTPASIGSLTIKNRVIMAPMTTRLATEDGYVTDASIAYFCARARGGVGLITVEMASPEIEGRHRAHELGIYGDQYLPGLTRLVDALHASGAKASIQLGHAGGHTRKDISGLTPLAPSALPHDVYEVTMQTIMPDEISQERIAQTVQAFVNAALRAQKAGFDCIEIHGAHGYLLSQFLCPAENIRDDEYGGSIQNRLRISLEIINGIKAAAPNFPLIYRLNVDDLFPEGLQFSEGFEMAKILANSGIDAIHVTAGHYKSLPSAERMIPPMYYPEATFANFAKEIKQVVDIPVITVGRLGNPVIANRLLEESQADFIALGRPLLADPDWVNKAAAAQPIRPCLACNTCVNEMRGGKQLGCLVNPAAAHELKYPNLTPKIQGERIAIIGAGPAGLSYAAIVSTKNEVTIFDQSPEVGGAWLYASKAPRFQEVKTNPAAFHYFLEQLRQTCKIQGVHFQMGIHLEVNDSRLNGFDRIVIATGAKYRFGLSWLMNILLHPTISNAPWIQRIFSSDALKNILYYKARVSQLPTWIIKQKVAPKVHVIGDAKTPGKSDSAIQNAFSLAFQEP